MARDAVRPEMPRLPLDDIAVSEVNHRSVELAREFGSTPSKWKTPSAPAVPRTLVPSVPVTKDSEGSGGARNR